MKSLANSYLKPHQLKQHLNNAHKYQASQLKFESNKGCLKSVRLDARGAFNHANFSIVKASYVVAFRITKAKKSHIIAEILV